jgi:molybdopterin-containing oxidoreductase family membrane subunit
MLVFSITYIWRIEALKPFTKIAAVAAFASVIAAGVAILTDLGQPFRVLQMLIHPQPGSPLFWDVVILGLYAVICFVAVLLQLLPLTKGNQFKRAFATDCEVASRRLSFIALPFLVVLNAGTALMFAVQPSREWWHSAVLPVDAIAVGAATGIALMLIVQSIVCSDEGYEKWNSGFVILARIGAAAILAHFVFSILELVTIAWNGGLEGQELIHLVLGKYGFWYFIEMVLPLIAMIAWFLYKGGSRKLVSIFSVLVLIGMFIQKMMHFMPAFNQIPLTLPSGGAANTLWSFPISSGFFREGEDLFIRSYDYMPSMPEIAVGLLPVGLLIFVIAAACALFKLIPEAWQKQIVE